MLAEGREPSLSGLVKGLRALKKAERETGAERRKTTDSRIPRVAEAVPMTCDREDLVLVLEWIAEWNADTVTRALIGGRTHGKAESDLKMVQDGIKVLDAIRREIKNI